MVTVTFDELPVPRDKLARSEFLGICQLVSGDPMLVDKEVLGCVIMLPLIQSTKIVDQVSLSLNLQPSCYSCASSEEFRMILEY